MSTVKDLTIGYPLDQIARNQPFALFIPGADAYSQVRINSEITLTGSDGKTEKALAATRVIGPLVNLVPQYGELFAPLVGRRFDGASLGDALDEMYPDNDRASALSTVYTVIVFQGMPDRVDQP